MERRRSIQVLVLGGPAAPGGRALLARADAAAAAGRPVRLLLSGGGLAWAGEASLAALAERPDVDVALCSRSARDAGYAASTLPAYVRWSSLLRWLLDRDASGELWGLLP